MNRNPKHKDSMLVDVRPQTGKCPGLCRECFYNLAYYEDINKPHIPNPEEFDPDSFVYRVNPGHDSNCERTLVMRTCRKYKHKFFNTIYPHFWFKAPVVLTVNPREYEEHDWTVPRMIDGSLLDLMFVRYRINHWNSARCVSHYRDHWRPHDIPMVLTFMRDYSHTDAPHLEPHGDQESPADLFERGPSVINYCWEYTSEVKESILSEARRLADIVHMCGTPTSNLCKDCKLCYSYYWITLKRMKGI